MAIRFYVRAEWDSEAEAFISVTNIPGLNVEAASLAEFLSIVEELAPAMVEANVPATERTAVTATPRLDRLELEVAA